MIEKQYSLAWKEQCYEKIFVLAPMVRKHRDEQKKLWEKQHNRKWILPD